MNIDICRPLRATAAVVILLSLPSLGAASVAKADSRGVKDLIAKYVLSIEKADTTMAEEIFSHGQDVTFIHPRGEEHGLTQIVTDFYRSLMADTFSERHLTPKDIAVSVYGDTAWAEFNWDFVAKVKKDGSAFHSQGRETQVYHRESKQWRIVHVHYSGVPVSGELKGF